MNVYQQSPTSLRVYLDVKMQACVGDAGRLGAAWGVCAGSGSEPKAQSEQHDSLMAGFYLQDNGQFLPLSVTCKSNWRHHYAAVIGSFVNG